MIFYLDMIKNRYLTSHKILEFALPIVKKGMNFKKQAMKYIINNIINGNK